MSGQNLTFQDVILNLHAYWGRQGCLLVQPYDVCKGAGTLNPHTFLRALGPEPWRAAYVEPSRRPTDGRYGENPFRLQHYYQYQVILKPVPPDAQELYEGSLRELGIDLTLHDVRYVEDDWEQPTFGAAGLGWEFWLDGMEVTQFTYFQQVGGIDLDPPSLELTYGLERVAMFIQGASSIYDLEWVTGWTYGDVHLDTEKQGSAYNFEQAPVEILRRHFDDHEAEAFRLADAQLVYSAYDQVLHMSHIFNLLDARRAISVAQRVQTIARIRKAAGRVAREYIQHREALSFPFLKKGHEVPAVAVSAS